MITRSMGMTTGTGYVVGGGYEGKTKELDKAVIKLSKRLEKEFNMDVEIRFNSDRESGGAFIKALDKGFDYTIGVNAEIHSSEYRALPDEQKYNMSIYDYKKYPKDLLLFGVVLGEKVSLIPKEKIWEKEFKTINGAFNFLYKCLNKNAMNKYLKIT